jgi:hypothetical protein
MGNFSIYQMRWKKKCPKDRAMMCLNMLLGITEAMTKNYIVESKQKVMDGLCFLPLTV